MNNIASIIIPYLKQKVTKIFFFNVKYKFDPDMLLCYNNLKFIFMFAFALLYILENRLESFYKATVIVLLQRVVFILDHDCR